jgi:transglutaminase-like putative cysteine protease
MLSTAASESAGHGFGTKAARNSSGARDFCRRPGQVFRMRIRVGFEMIYDFPQATPLIAVVGTHFSRASDVIEPDYLTISPSVPITPYRDGFGNWCSRIVAPAGRVRLAADGLVRDSGQPDVIVPDAAQHAVEDLPADAIVYLLGSRYCETDRLSDIAWKLFEKTKPGWARVQAICDFVHNHIAFGYEHARATKTAWEAFDEGKGVCRDYAHLAIAFCRCMNIPARYCTGYLGDIGMPPPYAAGDFAGWFEAYIGGRWYTFDARNNIPRIGRVLIAQGRDAAYVPITQTFGPNTLVNFTVWTDEVV